MEQQNKDQNVIGKLVDEVQKILAKKDQKIAKLEEQIRELKAKMAKKETYFKELKSSIRRRGVPTELMNELFASLPIENAFSLLVKMPNGILARNVQKMINGINEALKYNKLNTEDCGPRIIIHEDGLIAKHLDGPFELNCLRALLPIPTFNLKALNKTRIAFYFEMEILNEY